jgi:hypothetical protein
LNAPATGVHSLSGQATNNPSNMVLEPISGTPLWSLLDQEYKYPTTTTKSAYNILEGKHVNGVKVDLFGSKFPSR